MQYTVVNKPEDKSSEPTSYTVVAPASDAEVPDDRPRIADLIDREPSGLGYKYTPEQIARQQELLASFDVEDLPEAPEWLRERAEMAPEGVHELDAFVPSFLNSMSVGIAAHQNDDSRELMRTVREAQPEWSLAGDIAGFLMPGSAAFKAFDKLARTAGRLVNPAGKVLSGSGFLSRLGRYAPVVGSGTAASVADYGLYESTVGVSNRAADEDRAPTLEERIEAFKQAPTEPLAYTGGLISPIYRGLRGAGTTLKNTAQATKQAGKFTPKAGSFTPTPRAQWAAQVMKPTTPQSEAYKMIAKRLDADGITPEQLHKAIDHYYYAGYSTVDEMLFELAEAASGGKGGGQLKQLAVALGSVGGDAQTTARDAFFQRRQTSLTRLRDDLRKAAGLEGTDFYKYSDELKAAERTLPDYEPAYSKSISDASWKETLWPQIQTSPSAREALDRAWKYASDRGDVEIAREIDTLIQGLGPNPARSGVPGGAPGNVPTKPSTQALDFIDRSLGGRAHSLRVRGDGDIAGGTQEAQAGLRRVVDAETGLDQPRRIVHELKTAQGALEFGRKSAASGTDLETIQREFAREMKKFADDGVEVLAEETPTINAALMMGWVRGAEDMISKASNPGTAIRQLYGTPRQREKMVAMLEGLDESALATSGKQSDATKRLRQVTGNKYKAGDTPQGQGRFDRERKMLNSENQIVGNSQTGQRNEAVAAQGGLEEKINMALDAIDAPRQMAKKAVRQGVNRLARPGIYKPDVNRELGDILFQGGHENLKRIVRELENYSKVAKQAAKSKKAASAPATKKAVNSGIPGGFLSEMTAGGVVGGNIPYDYDGDGEVTLKDRAIGAGIGATGSQLLRLGKAYQSGANKGPNVAAPGTPRPAPQDPRVEQIRMMQNLDYLPSDADPKGPIAYATARLRDTPQGSVRAATKKDFEAQIVDQETRKTFADDELVSNSTRRGLARVEGAEYYNEAAYRLSIAQLRAKGLNTTDLERQIKQQQLKTMGQVERLRNKIADNEGFERRPELLPDPEQFSNPRKKPIKGRSSERGSIDVGGGPRRRKDVLRELRNSEGPQFKVNKSVKLSDLPSAPPPEVSRGFGIMDSPLPALAAVGAGGTGIVAGIRHLTRPQAATKAEDDDPSANGYIDSVLGNLKASKAAEEERISKGLPRTPGLKPDLTEAQDKVRRRANRDAVSAERSREDKFQDWLRYKHGSAASVRWTKLKEKMASQLRVRPDDRRNGIARKRMVYDYDIPIDSLLDGSFTPEIEVLMDGKWMASEDVP